MKTTKNRRKGLLVFLAILLLILCALLMGYRYLLGKMERDLFVSREALAVVDTGNIVRETMPETTENGLLNEDGELIAFQLPEEALAILRGGSGGTGTAASDTDSAETAPVETSDEIIVTETETETQPETETETAAETIASETKTAETRPADTKAKETRPADTKAKETKTAETKAAETAAPAAKNGREASYLKKGAEKIKTFVLYGLDAKKSSDVIILAALDPVHNKCKIISLARDTYTYLADRNVHTKLTYAYSLGGAAMAVKTLNENFYLYLEDYVAVDFEQAISVIDLLGGSTVELDERELEYMGEWEGLQPGTNQLDGRQSVKYARIRQIDNDLVRNDRQREVIKSLFTNLRSLKITDYPALIREAAGMCATSFTDAEMIALGTTFFSMKGCTFEQYNFPNSNTDCWGGTIDEQFYWVYDLARVSDEIYRIIYEDLYVSGYDIK